jgi:hypothetical protein
MEDGGSLKWTGDLVGDQIPDYAIFSHTWGSRWQELAFNDLKNLDEGKNVDAIAKDGYRKILFCAQQAQKDGLKYFWVDTCCIDKSNSIELQVAINSMFRWYQNAKKCYVYLSDVERNTIDVNDVSALKKSRWFTRGWTLQELLAPKSVGFYSKEGDWLGDKQSLKHIIYEITNIPIDALSGTPLIEFSVDERLSWAELRQTTYEEDQVYCLLGIFGIYMPVVYGEGASNAMRRLKSTIRDSLEDDKLAKRLGWIAAPDPSTNHRRAIKHWQNDTGLWLLQGDHFARWKVSPASNLWLYGLPGCGKTVLSAAIVQHLLQHCYGSPDMVIVYFYFDFRDVQKQDAECMLRSLLSQLLQHLTTMPDILDTLFLSFENGQQRPSVPALLEVTRETMLQFTHVYVVLDALDECAYRPELMNMLEIVAGWELKNLHLLMTSRKEQDIRSSLAIFVYEGDAVCFESNVIDRDIQQYVQERLSNDKSLSKWKKDAAIMQEIEAALMRGACGMYLRPPKLR